MLPRDLDPYIIGLWRFRQPGRRPVWCATYCYRGKYYDAQGGDSVGLDEVLAAVRRGLARLRRTCTRSCSSAGRSPSPSTR
jgi:hypothetical protein